MTPCLAALYDVTRRKYCMFTALFPIEHMRYATTDAYTAVCQLRISRLISQIMP